MRQIVFLKLQENDPGLWKLLLERCSHHTPLVEPAENFSVYLDLSGCGNALHIVQNISSFMRSHSRQVRLRAGLAASRLLAGLAIQSSLQCCPTESYQLVSAPGLLAVKVLPGCEKNFIAPLPLADLPSLSVKAIKSLSRLGFTNIGELDCLSVAQLARLKIQEPRLFMQYISGLDNSPVTGLYPPSRITYPLNLQGCVNERLRVEKILRIAACRLEGLLEERHAGCRYIILQMLSGEAPPKKERKLSSHCFRAEQLLNIFISLFPWEYLEDDCSALQIILQDISSLSFCQPDLFVSRVFLNEQEQEDRVEELLLNLRNRFPGHLRQGLELDRREKALALWDPWRKGFDLNPNSGNT